MLGYELDFNSCAVRDGFCKSSHKYFESLDIQFHAMNNDKYLTCFYPTKMAVHEFT